VPKSAVRICISNLLILTPSPLPLLSLPLSSTPTHPPTQGDSTGSWADNFGKKLSLIGAAKKYPMYRNNAFNFFNGFQLQYRFDKTMSVRACSCNP
jgi:hypothetical protein